MYEYTLFLSLTFDVVQDKGSNPYIREIMILSLDEALALGQFAYMLQIEPLCPLRVSYKSYHLPSKYI